MSDSFGRGWNGLRTMTVTVAALDQGPRNEDPGLVSDVWTRRCRSGPAGRLPGRNAAARRLSGAVPHGAGLSRADLRGSDLSTLDPMTTKVRGAVIDLQQAVVPAGALGLERASGRTRGPLRDAAMNRNPPGDTDGMTGSD